jgi:hypothetical protein
MKQTTEKSRDMYSELAKSIFKKLYCFTKEKKNILLKILLPTPNGEQKEIPQMG